MGVTPTKENESMFKYEGPEVVELVDDASDEQIVEVAVERLAQNGISVVRYGSYGVDQERGVKLAAAVRRAAKKLAVQAHVLNEAGRLVLVVKGVQS